jgi:hypothetical protein
MHKGLMMFGDLSQETWIVCQSLGFGLLFGF